MFGKRKSGEESSPESSHVPAKRASPRGGGSDAVLRDELGLYHLWYLEQRLRDELARASRMNSVFSVAAWQLRLLPGESPTPEQLVRIAEFIRASLRSYDVVARIDQERFGAILFDAQFEKAATVAFRIKGDLQVRVPTAGKWLAGVSSFPRDGVDAEGLIQTTLRRLAADTRAA